MASKLLVDVFGNVLAFIVFFSSFKTIAEDLNTLLCS